MMQREDQQLEKTPTAKVPRVAARPASREDASRPREATVPALSMAMPPARRCSSDSSVFCLAFCIGCATKICSIAPHRYPTTF